MADPAPKPRPRGAERVRRVNAKQPRVTPTITITGAGPMTPAIRRRCKLDRGTGQAG